MHLFQALWAAQLLVMTVVCVCHDPSPAFPVPSWEEDSAALSEAFERIESRLKEVVSKKEYDVASFSIELTTNTRTIWSHSHTARKLNETRPGTTHVDADSMYRIASISKVFTTLGLLYQHEAGNVSLNEPVSTYIPKLSGQIPWDDITLRALATQISGIPRDYALGDLINRLPDPTVIGLPPASKEGLPTCNEFWHFDRPCKRDELIEGVKDLPPLYAPNQKSTYSNLNYELLGLVIENVTGMTFKEYVQAAIFDPLEMSSSTLDKPADSRSVIPIGETWWDVDQGVMDPTGGIYSSASDLSKFLRYILTHYNAIATGVNWILPVSWTEDINSFYGMPFEIFRTNRILQDSKRPVTFVTKSGGLPGYYSRISIMPEYGLGLTVLVSSEIELLHEIQELVTVAVTRAAEDIIWKDVTKRYGGSYHATASSLNSSLTLSASSGSGLVLRSFVSNGTDVFNDVIPYHFADNSRPWRAQLLPTLLFKNETAQQGEIWRMMVYYDRLDLVWDDFCVTDIDGMYYAGLPINEVVFWHEQGIVEIPAWRLKLKRDTEDEQSPLIVVQ